MPAPAATPEPSAAAPASDPDSQSSEAVRATPELQPPPPCPADMRHIQHQFCPDLERRCVKSEYSKSNRITICHQFADGENECRSERRLVDVCIDKYEYPNQEGGHPPVMVDFFDAERSCQRAGKRLCLESEWIAACEGASEKPFPYGWERSSEACNIDNPWIEPSLGKIYSKRSEIRDPELERLDQSVPSGSRPSCVSEFGVYDLTGNFDEWVRLDEPKPGARSKQAGLKGGAWGHVRNACRPVTTSHAPEFTYYFISFRCCKDPVDSG